jgi:hypothetical protein
MLIKSHNSFSLFSQIKLENNVGILEAKRALNCEKRKNYKFEIEATMCDGSKSERYCRA